MPRRLALASFLMVIATFGAEASDARRFAASEGLRAGMPFAEARRRLLRGGWHPYRGHGSTALSRCEDRPAICRAYPEAGGCWREAGVTFCSFEYLDTRRRPARLSDEVQRLQVRIGSDGRPLYESHHTTSFGGHG